MAKVEMKIMGKLRNKNYNKIKKKNFTTFKMTTSSSKQKTYINNLQFQLLIIFEEQFSICILIDFKSAHTKNKFITKIYYIY